MTLQMISNTPKTPNAPLSAATVATFPMISVPLGFVPLVAILVELFQWYLLCSYHLEMIQVVWGMLDLHQAMLNQQ